MPYSFTQIEEDKSRTIKVVFGFLIFIYFVAAYCIAWLVINYLYFEEVAYFQPKGLDFFQILWVFIISCGVALLHWGYTIYDLINKVLRMLNAKPLDHNDSYHAMFRNIIEEVAVATGGRKIEGVVIPSIAMNAFAVADFQGRSVIGVTEGLLARLNRSQLEAVVGHEAAHIVSGDCLSTTVTSSLFELYGGVLKAFSLFSDNNRTYRMGRGRYSGSGGGGGGVIILLMLIYILIVVIHGISQLFKLFISREREYRADAVAVRLTRDPLSLAEALYSISYHWRGTGLPAQEMEAIFILSPKWNLKDESEGFFADLFSTHPPVEKRMKILLDMAHANLAAVENSVKAQHTKPRVTVPQTPIPVDSWMVHYQGQWSGPYEYVQLATFDWLQPETWVKKTGSDKMMMAYQEPLLAGNLRKIRGAPGYNKCPKCQIELTALFYEGTTIQQCSFCKGVFARYEDIQKIILRREVGFNEDIRHKAEIIEREAKTFLINNKDFNKEMIYPCPQCANHYAKLRRGFYTDAYRVVIDRCLMCGYVWFDAQELEILQYMIEKNSRV